MRPDFYVKGHEYASSGDPDFARERSTVESYGGRVIFGSGEVIYSSTRIIEHLGRLPQVECQRLATFCARHQLTNASLALLLQSLRDLRVLVIGDTIIDRYVFCDAQSLASESPMISLTELEDRSYLGGAAVVARHIAAMGASASLITCAGSDELSDYLARSLDAARIDHHLLRVRPGLVQKTRFIVDDAKLFKVGQGHPHPLDSQAERFAADAIIQKVPSVDAVIWCDFGYGAITDGLWSRVAGEVRRNAGTVSADVSGERSHLLSFANTDLLCPTERELRAAINDFDSGLSAVAWKCLQRTQAHQMLVTLDKRGLVAFDRQSHDPSSPQWRQRLRSEHLPALAEQGVDKLGCGDALLAAATLGLAAGASLAQAAYLGSAAAAIELTRMGNIPVSARDLTEWLDSRSELRPAAQPGVQRRRPPARFETASAG
jgi:rfaE bifunctional protein kinase chain/domain